MVESRRTLELKQDGLPVDALDLRLLATAQKIIVCGPHHSGISVRLHNIEEWNALTGPGKGFARDLELVVTFAAERDRILVPLRMVRPARQRESARAAVAEIPHYTPYRVLVVAQGVTYRVQPVALRNPREQAQRLQRVALARSVRADQHRQRRELQRRRLAEALEILDGKTRQHRRLPATRATMPAAAAAVKPRPAAHPGSAPHPAGIARGGVRV